MILADTSAWIEYDRASGSPADRAIANLISTSNDLALTEPVIMEILVGARSERAEQSLRRFLLRFPLLQFHPTSDFDAAVRVYRQSRSAGFTPRGLVDCMVAAVAWRCDAALLTLDADLIRIASAMNIEVHNLEAGD